MCRLLLIFSLLFLSTSAFAEFRDPASVAPTMVKWDTKQPAPQDPIGISVMCSTGNYSVVSVSLQNRTGKSLCLAPSSLVMSKSDEKKDPTFDCRVLPGNAHDLRQFSPATASSISGCGGVGTRILPGDIYEAKFTFDPNELAKTSSRKYEVSIPSSCDTRTAVANKYDFECSGQ